MKNFVASRLSNFWNSFWCAVQLISCCDWWSWTKPGYITMTRRDNNNKQSGGIAAHLTSKNSEWKNQLKKFLPRYFGIKTVSSSLIIFQRAKLSTHFCWCNWRIFWRKNAAGRSPRGFRSCTTMARLTRHLQPRRNWPTWASNVSSPTLFSGSSPVRLPPVLWTEKTIERSLFFFRRGDHCCRRHGWTDNNLSYFWVDCKSYSNWLTSVLSFVGSMFNKSLVWLL